MHLDRCLSSGVYQFVSEVGCWFFGYFLAKSMKAFG